MNHTEVDDFDDTPHDRRDEIDARLNELGVMYRFTRDRIVELTLLDIALTARHAYEGKAAYVQLYTNDEDDSQVVGAVLDAEGNLLDEECEPFAALQVGNLDGDTAHVWQPFCVTIDLLDGGYPHLQVKAVLDRLAL